MPSLGKIMLVTQHVHGVNQARTEWHSVTSIALKASTMQVPVRILLLYAKLVYTVNQSVNLINWCWLHNAWNWYWPHNAWNTNHTPQIHLIVVGINKRKVQYCWPRLVGWQQLQRYTDPSNVLDLRTYLGCNSTQALLPRSNVLFNVQFSRSSKAFI